MSSIDNIVGKSIPFGPSPTRKGIGIWSVPNFLRRMFSDTSVRKHQSSHIIDIPFDIIDILLEISDIIINIINSAE